MAIDAAFLASVGLFADLPRRDLDLLAGAMQRRKYARGKAVFVKGELGTSLYVVEEGRVKLVATSPEGDELILHVIGPGECFGELAVLDGEPRQCDAVAQKPTVLLVLHRDDFVPLIRTRPEVATRLITVLGSRLRQLAELAENEAFLNVHSRLAKVLLDLSGADARPGEDGLVISPKVTQTDLAGMIGTTRRSVNKWLSYYKRKGLIRFDRGYITLLQPELLRKRAS